MTLNVSTLRSSLSPLFRAPTMPKGGVADASRQWVSSYIPYAADAIAAGARPVGLSSFPGSNGQFISALDAALRSMWVASSWIGPGVTGVTLLVPPLAPLMAPVMASLIKSRDPELALSLITDALHTYTLSITVTITPIGGVPFVTTLA